MDDYFPDDVNGHGTHVAGTLAATAMDLALSAFAKERR